MAASLASSYNLLHRLRRPPQPSPSASSSSIFSLLLNPLSGSATTASRTAALPISTVTSAIISSSPSLLHTLTSNPLLVSPSSLPLTLRRCLSSSSAAFTQTPTHQDEVEEDEDADDVAARNEFDADESDYSDEDEEGIEAEEEEEKEESERSVSPRPIPAKEKPPTLSVKEKKELASYAHSLGKKLKSQLVGKSGVTDGVAASFIENLESNELLKIKIHRTCPGDLEEVVELLSVSTGSVVVSQIGRTVIIYRPSLTKLKAEEKKLQARRVYVRKESQPKLAILKRGQAPGITARGGQRSSNGRAMRSYSSAPARGGRGSSSGRVVRNYSSAS